MLRLSFISIVALAAFEARAGVQTFNDPAAFVAALQQAGLAPAPALTFERLAPGTLLPTGQQIAGYPGFWSFQDWVDDPGFFVPVAAEVTDYFPTHSPLNGLGLSSAWGRFLPGDRVGVFHGGGTQVRAVGLVVVTTPYVPAGAITLSTPLGSVSNLDSPFAVFGQGQASTEGHFLGVIADTPIIGCELSSAPLSGVFAWTLDTVYGSMPAAAIPASSPQTLGLLAASLGLGAALLIRRHNA